MDSPSNRFFLTARTLCLDISCNSNNQPTIKEKTKVNFRKSAQLRTWTGQRKNRFKVITDHLIRILQLIKKIIATRIKHRQFKANITGYHNQPGTQVFMELWQANWVIQIIRLSFMYVMRVRRETKISNATVTFWLQTWNISKSTSRTVKT